MNRRVAFIEGFKRADCARCGAPCITLGEAIRVECAEGRFVIVHACLPCVKRAGLRVLAGEHAPQEQERGRRAA